MREIIAKNSMLLKNDDWVQLRTMKAPEKKINGYTYSHEIRCEGSIVAFLPFRRENNDFWFLLRKEAVPCWELDTPILCSFTGGVDKDSEPYKTFINELREEAGYILDSEEDANRLFDLSTTYATKSTDSIFYLYAVDVTDFPKEKTKELYIETELEEASTNEWHEIGKLNEIKDPFVSQIVLRLICETKK